MTVLCYCFYDLIYNYKKMTRMTEMTAKLENSKGKKKIN